MNFENQKINEAYAKIHEADTVRRSPARVITHGRDEFNKPYGNGETLDDRINLRGKAANLRDYEMEKASHLSNVVSFWENNKEMLMKLQSDLEKEMEADSSLWELSSIIDKFNGLLEDAAFEANEKLNEIKSDVNKPYHVGKREFFDSPNTTEH